jgi:hypothetical protein
MDEQLLAETQAEPAPLPLFTVERSLHPLRLALRTRKRCYLALLGFELGKSTWGRWYAYFQLGDKTAWLRRY